MKRAIHPNNTKTHHNNATTTHAKSVIKEREKEKLLCPSASFFGLVSDFFFKGTRSKCCSPAEKE